MHNKQLAELTSRLSRASDITLIIMLTLFCVFAYQAVLPQTIKIGTIILCSIGIFDIIGGIYTIFTILFGIIATAFYIYVPIHWAIYTPLLISFSLLCLFLLIELEDFIYDISDKIEYLKNIVTLKNEITLSHNSSSPHNPNRNHLPTLRFDFPPHPLHDKMILHDQVTTITIKKTYLIWKHPIKNKEGILTRHKLLSEQMAKLSPPILDTTVLKEVKQESKKYFFIFCHDIIRISYDMPVDTIKEGGFISERMHDEVVVSREQYFRLTDDLINHIVKTLENTPELEYLARRFT